MRHLLRRVSCLLFALLVGGPVLAQSSDEAAPLGNADPARTGSQGVAEWAAGARPTPALWLVIDDGRGPRLVASRQASAVAPLVASASGQGLRLALPEGGSGDDGVGMSAAWEADAAAARRIAGRYGSGELVLGRLFRGGQGWQAEWRLVDMLGEEETWTSTHSDALALLGASGDEIALRFARRSQEMLDAGSAGAFTVVIEGLNSGAEYARLVEYLGGLPVVRTVVPLEAGNDHLRLQLDLATGPARLEQMIEAGNVLSVVAAGGDEGRYRLR